MNGETPMIEQYRGIKEKYPDAILFFRLGDFYEMFFEDAVLASRLLEIALTGREAGKSLGRVPMCGVPYHAATGYIQKLIAAGQKVAICDQVEDPRQARGIVRREVTRVITPGTVVDPALLEERRSTYVVAVAGQRDRVGLACSDVSTGEFATTELTGESALRLLADEIGRLRPAEVVLEPAADGLSTVLEPLCQGIGAVLGAYQQASFAWEAAYRKLTRHFGTASLRGFGCEDLPAAVSAAGALLQYIEDAQKCPARQVTTLLVYFPGDFMELDAATRRNLELTARLSEGARGGTLLACLDQTVTAMGGRALRGWIERPLRERAAIDARLEAVQALVEDSFLRADVRELLGSVYDLERLAGRCAGGTANARDLVALRTSLTVVPHLRELLVRTPSPLLQALGAELDPLEEVAQLITRAVVDDPPALLTEGGLIRTGYDQQVDELRAASRDGKQWIARLEAQERERTGIKSLKVGYNRVFGYYLEVTSANLGAVPPEYTRKQTLANGERFVTPELKEQESLVLGAEERVTALEYELFLGIRAQVARHGATLQRNGRAVASLDALAGLAQVAVERGYARPLVDDSDVIAVTDGRHPVLDQILGAEGFVPNDVLLDGGEHRLLIITGPNMGGKSTYLRQVALIALMAQVGSFVPARAARVGLVDRIFTRVGAADDLATGQSTFMLEMTETANIMRSATRRSLVLLDEIGRGTSTLDGLAIAWSVAEYVHGPRVGARTMFATHYHELTELEHLLPGAKNFSVAVKEKGEEIVFLRRIVRGGTDRSYGIQVARLAGVPREVIERAREVLEALEALQAAKGGRHETAAERATQLSFLEPTPHPVLEEVRQLDLLDVTPRRALELLFAWQERLRQDG